MTYERTEYFNSWEEAYKDAKARGVCPLQELLARRRKHFAQLERENQELRDRVARLSKPVWEVKFPHVHFTDKVHIDYKDGTSQCVKHLYNGTSELLNINWDDVVDCDEC